VAEGCSWGLGSAPGAATLVKVGTHVRSKNAGIGGLFLGQHGSLEFKKGCLFLIHLLENQKRRYSHRYQACWDHSSFGHTDLHAIFPLTVGVKTFSLGITVGVKTFSLGISDKNICRFLLKFTALNQSFCSKNDCYFISGYLYISSPNWK